MVTLTYNGAIRTANALQETATPKNAEATVKHRFVSFNGDTAATLGSFGVSANTELLAADDGLAVELAAGNTDVIDPAMGTVTISGDFSFASRV